MKKIILLDGNSSAGKTSIAKAIQEQAKEQIYRLSIDDFLLHTIPQKIIESREGYSLRDKIDELMFGFYKLVRFYSESMGIVVVDLIFQREAWREYFFSCIKRSHVFYVQLFCSLQELEKRESARTDRAAGGARSIFEMIYSFKEYDLQVDSSENSIQKCAQDILLYWNKL